MNRLIKSLFVAGAMVTGVFASAKDVKVFLVRNINKLVLLLFVLSIISCNRHNQEESKDDLINIESSTKILSKQVIINLGVQEFVKTGSKYTFKTYKDFIYWENMKI